MPEADPGDDAPRERTGGEPAAGERAIRATTITAVITVATIAALVSYRHMRAVAIEYGEDRLNAAVIPLSVDGLIVAASMAILAETRADRVPPRLPYALLVLGSAASLAANVMHAHPDTPSRIIAAWPPAALIGTYELLMRQIRSPAAPRRTGGVSPDDQSLTKKQQLRRLVDEQVAVDDRRTIPGLARDLAPQIHLHPGTARRYLPELLAELGSARAAESPAPARAAAPPTSAPLNGARSQREKAR